MTPRAGVLLFALGLVVLAAGYALGPASVATERAAFSRGTPMFPGFAAAAQAAVKIELTAKGQHFTIDRPSAAPDAVWGLAERAGYPVQPARVHALLAGLAELRLVEPRTSDPALYGRLGLAPDGQVGGQPAGEATDLRVIGADGKALAAVQVGRQPAGAPEAAGNAAPGTVYVRRLGESETWLAEGRLPVETDGQTWLEHEVANIDAAKITRITVERGAARLVLAREGAAMQVSEPAPPPPADPTKLDETARALELLVFEDVRRADPGAPVLATTMYQTADGMRLTATQRGDDKEAWTHFAAAGPGAEALDARLAGWDFRLGSFKDRLIAPTAETLKPPPAPQTTPGSQLPGLVSPAPGK